MFCTLCCMDEDAPYEGVMIGKGALHWGHGRIGSVSYKLHFSPANGQATVVELYPKPAARDGQFLRLTLEDGRVVNCQVLDDSPFCAVIGDGPIIERRKRVRGK